MKRKLGLLLGLGIAGVLTLVAWLLIRQAHFDVLSPSGEIAEQQRNLLIFTLCLSALVVIPVYIMLGMFAWRYREGNEKARYEPEWSNHKILEGVWWGIPIAIIGVLSVVTWQTSHALDPYRRLASDQKTINVQVVALQWKWLFIYPDYNVATVNQLVVPEKAPIHFTLTANAPMSGFWIPALGTQVYAMDGMSSQLNLKANHVGEFTGYSTNINGRGYADMKFRVRSVNKQDFEKWASQAAKSEKQLRMDSYMELAKPSVEKSPQTYVLADPALYQEITGTAMPMSGMDHMDTNMNHGDSHE